MRVKRILCWADSKWHSLYSSPAGSMFMNHYHHIFHGDPPKKSSEYLPRRCGHNTPFLDIPHPITRSYLTTLTSIMVCIICQLAYQKREKSYLTRRKNNSMWDLTNTMQKERTGGKELWTKDVLFCKTTQYIKLIIIVLLSPFQIIRLSGSSKYIIFTMYLDIVCI